MTTVREAYRAWRAHPGRDQTARLARLETAWEAASRHLDASDEPSPDPLAEQVFAAIAIHTVRSAGSEDAKEHPLVQWPLLAALAEETPEATSRRRLVGHAIAGGIRNGHLEPACLARLAPMLEADRVAAWARAELAGELSFADQGVLLALLPKEERERELEGRLATIVSIPEGNERWSALGDLASHLPEPDDFLRPAVDACVAGCGFDLHTLHFVARRTPDAAEGRLAAMERATFGAPFTAWRLGERARMVADPSERAVFVERAIDAFEAIAHTPVDPGNDEGPFWALARTMNDAQVERALGVVARMSAARWYGNLAGSRSALAVQLARLGRWEEGRAVAHGISPEEDDWRAATFGGIVGARLVSDAALGFTEALSDLGDVPELATAAGRFAIVQGVVQELVDDGAKPGRVPAALAEFAGTIDDPKLAAVAFDYLLGAFPLALDEDPAGSVARALAYIDASSEESHRSLLFTLAEAVRDAGGDPRPALERAMTTADRHEAFEELAAYRDVLRPAELRRFWTAWIRPPGDPPPLPHVAWTFVPELARVIRWLGGPSAPALVGEAIADARNRQPDEDVIRVCRALGCADG